MGLARLRRNCETILSGNLGRPTFISFTKRYTNQLKYYTKARTNLLISSLQAYFSPGERMKKKDRSKGRRKLAGAILGYPVT